MEETTQAGPEQAAGRPRGVSLTGQPRGHEALGLCSWCEERVLGRLVRATQEGRLVLTDHGTGRGVRAHWLAVRQPKRVQP